MLSAGYWIEARKAQNPARSFGVAPAAALQALRAVIGLAQGPGSAAGAAPGEQCASRHNRAASRRSTPGGRQFARYPVDGVRTPW